MSYRPYQVRGDTQRGSLSLAAEGEPRLSIQWARARTRPARAEAMVRRALLRGLRGRARRRAAAEVRRLDGAGLEPLLCRDDAETNTIHGIGFAPGSRRLVELVHPHVTPREDRLIERIAYREARDQAPDAPQRWALFDLSFVAPARLRYESSTLNVGDMMIRLTGPASSRWRRTTVTVRHIYPADLALKRRPLAAWLDSVLATRRREYRRRRRAGPYEALVTDAGAGLTADTRLRPSLRPFRQRTPRRQRHWLVHDERHNRLMLLEAADRADRLEQVLVSLVEGTYWAEGTEGEAMEGRGEGTEARRHEGTKG